MPIYEYKCTKCRREFEAIQGFSDKPLKKCEKCGGKIHKLVSQSSFHLKGTGWYVTDYSSSKRPGTKPQEPKEPKESKSPESSKSDDKKSTSKKSDSPKS